VLCMLCVCDALSHCCCCCEFCFHPVLRVRSPPEHSPAHGVGSDCPRTWKVRPPPLLYTHPAPGLFPWASGSLRGNSGMCVCIYVYAGSSICWTTCCGVTACTTSPAGTRRCCGGTGRRSPCSPILMYVCALYPTLVCARSDPLSACRWVGSIPSSMHSPTHCRWPTGVGGRCSSGADQVPSERKVDQPLPCAGGPSPYGRVDAV